MAFNIVLVEPEIPQNTGNIARTCAVSGTNLHLIKPYGFRITDKNLKRAGLDYWHLLNITEYDNLDDFFEKNKGCTFYLATSKGRHRHSDVKFKDGDFLIFGKESQYVDTFKSIVYQQMGRDLASNPRTTFGFADQIYRQMEKYVK